MNDVSERWHKREIILPDDKNIKPGNILVTPMSFSDSCIAMTDGDFYRDLEKKNPNFLLDGSSTSENFMPTSHLDYIHFSISY